ncbi:amino acid ABC transporter ATP-binding protein [Corynebacterium otitidis]
MTTPLIELEDVALRYPGGPTALDHVSLSVAPSEVVAIVGPSGSGKSTLLRAVNGLAPIDSGTIRLRGEATVGPGAGEPPWRAIRQDVGMVFQSYELFPHLSVEDNLTLAPKLARRGDKEELKERAHALLRRVGLGDRAGSRPGQLSGGQKQRVAIVRALMMRPVALLLDEITAALDPEMVAEVLHVVSELAEEGMTMLVVTHELSFARAVADRVVFMDDGAIVEEAEPEAFFTRPATERARAFLEQILPFE